MNKPVKRKLNIKLLRKIQKHILEEPRRFFMKGFLIKAETPMEWACERYSDASKRMPPCGTAACIAGWANLLTNGQANDINRAAKLIGIDIPKWEYSPLFETEGWPQPFRDRYETAQTPKLRAKIAAARIDYLIKEGK